MLMIHTFNNKIEAIVDVKKSCQVSGLYVTEITEPPHDKTNKMTVGPVCPV